VDEISIVIPVYNSTGTLKTLIEVLTRTIDHVVRAYEVILVNDGSRDGSWDVIVALSREYEHVHGLNLMRNYGQHNALLAGIREAQFPVIVTIDDDLQNPPEEIPNLLAKLAEGYDVVYGTPSEQKHSLGRNVASRITKAALQSAMGAETARNVSAFRAFRTHTREAFASYEGPSPSIDVLLTWGAAGFASVPVRQDPRRVGVSGYTLWKLMTHALNMMTGFSTLPLRVASIIGFAFTLFGITVLAYVLGRLFIQGDSVPGFPFLASVVAIFAGAQLFALGIIGEYLARMHFRLLDKPAYAIRERTSANWSHDTDERRPTRTNGLAPATATNGTLIRQ
jgi:undecaprenyl-phosphate 4-deoxy-4-formamido-L-arabinose transferase